MNIETTFLVASAIIGLGATVFMDVWAVLLKRMLNVPSADYCLVGRWFCHMPQGRFIHASIAATPRKRFECTIGWSAHYLIGVAYAVIFVLLVADNWLARPVLLPAIVFGVASVVVPYFVMQPAFGLGIAASRAPNPTHARLRSLMAHTVFGVGLFLAAAGLNYVVPMNT